MGSFQLEDFAAGWIGGAASVIVGHPLDTVKTRLQAGVNYGDTISCIRTVYRRESVFGFFKGMSFPLASIAVYNSAVFGVFSNTQRFLSQHHCRDPGASPSGTLSDLLLASMVAGVVSVGLGTPVDLIKIRLQMQTQPFQEANLGLRPRTMTLGKPPVYQGPVDCIATIVRTEGLAGMYRGVGAMLLRDVPGYCLYFIPYVFLNDWITPEACTGPSLCAVWLAGGMAGAISWGTATPMDVVKSRLQADGVYLNKYKGVLDCISQSYQKEGLKVSPTVVIRGQCQSLEGGPDVWGVYEVTERGIRKLKCSQLPYQARLEILVSFSPCPRLVEETEVQRGLVTYLRSHSWCMAEPGPRPTSVCHQSFSFIGIG
ncbi:solute carrier family 25 member 48 isoform X1 [Prionailurus bengalensis]|uniref:solute carrier family 25 member 48 isoform X1 n=1 Tax=Prionailurus bengalensis TaxID=37029 RepID=UPI001CA8C016|nr:solute carrier family 25 member 48 isoform X1 [Prionailurus bengalensis]